MKIDISYLIGTSDKKALKREVDESQIAKALAKALKVLRAYHGYTLKQVEETTEIPYPTISRYESGKNIPGAVQLFKLAHFYKFPVSDMFALGFFEGIEEKQTYTMILDHWTWADGFGRNMAKEAMLDD